MAHNNKAAHCYNFFSQQHNILIVTQNKTPYSLFYYHWDGAKLGHSPTLMQEIIRLSLEAVS